MAKLKIAHVRTTNTDIHDATKLDQYFGPEIISGNHRGGVGGAPVSVTTTGAPTIKVSFRTGGATYDGWIVAQKGSRKFRVTDGTHVATCILVNLNKAGLSVDGTMTILVTTTTGAFNASKISNKYVWDWNGTKSYGRYAYWFAAATAAGVVPPVSESAPGTYAQVASA